MNAPRRAVSVIVVALALTSPRLLEAQRQGFIIGIGAGPGVLTMKDVSPFLIGGTRESNTGVATHFRIGSMVSDAVQLYYSNRVIFHTSDNYDLVAGGMSALGITFLLPSAPKVHINGAAGISAYSTLDIDANQTTTRTGPGLAAGIGLDLTELLLLDFDVLWGRPASGSARISMFNLQVTLNIVSR